MKMRQLEWKTLIYPDRYSNQDHTWYHSSDIAPGLYFAICAENGDLYLNEEHYRSLPKNKDYKQQVQEIYEHIIMRGIEE